MPHTPKPEQLVKLRELLYNDRLISGSNISNPKSMQGCQLPNAGWNLNTVISIIKSALTREKNIGR
jgi:hypothetical protein